MDGQGRVTKLQAIDVIDFTDEEVDQIAQEAAERVETALGGKAPAGYVAYEVSVRTEEALETAVANAYASVSDGKIGFARITSDSNSISLVGGAWYITVYRCNDQYGTVKAVSYSASGPSIIYRNLFAGTWGEWEWVNPPMVTGVEYRTTERWSGKAVYTQLLNAGAVTAGTTAVAHGLALTQALECKACVYGGGTLPLKYSASGTDLEVNACAGLDQILIYANSAFDAVYCALKYTKD